MLHISPRLPIHSFSHIFLHLCVQRPFLARRVTNQHRAVCKCQEVGVNA